MVDGGGLELATLHPNHHEFRNKVVAPVVAAAIAILGLMLLNGQRNEKTGIDLSKVPPTPVPALQVGDFK